MNSPEEDLRDSIIHLTEALDEHFPELIALIKVLLQRSLK